MNKELKKDLDKAMELSADLFNVLSGIPYAYTHPCDIQETVINIHDIQNRIISIAYKNEIKLDTKIR